MKNQHSNYLLQLALATLFISASGALGRFIDMPTPVVVWWRSILGALFLLGFCMYKKFNLRIQSQQDAVSIGISALLMGGHWLFYFFALKLSNVAIGMLSLFVFPIFTAFLEPFFIKIKFDPIYILLGLMVLVGMYIMAPEFNLENTYFKGILFGLLSALCYALRNIISKKLTSSYNPTSIMFYQTSILTAVFLPALFFMDTSNIVTQYPYIILLAVVVTAIGHTLLIYSLKHFSVSTASIINSIQPIFGIIIAFIFLNEIPTKNTMLGGSLILATVLIESVRSRKK